MKFSSVFAGAALFASSVLAADVDPIVIKVRRIHIQLTAARGSGDSG